MLLCASRAHSLWVKRDYDITGPTDVRKGEMRIVSWDWGILQQVKNPLRTRMFAWWYFTIAGGFLLLALNRWLLGQRAGLVLAQLAAALAFALFGVISWN